MEWNNNIPIELLSQIRTHISKANLEVIQSVIDKDREICRTMLGHDVCGQYAPFCALCDKSMATPCAVAYIRMKQTEGVHIEIVITDDQAERIAPSEAKLAEETLVAESIAEEHLEIEVEAAAEEVAITEAIEEPKVEPPKRRIRIATLKRKANKK